MNATSLRSPPTGQSGSSAPRAGTGAGAEGVVNALGTVTSVLPGGLYSVDSDGRLLRCQRAASCLLRPEIGDLVLVSGPDPTEVQHKHELPNIPRGTDAVGCWELTHQGARN